MTQQLEDMLRTAFREKAEEIPAVAPPLELESRDRIVRRAASLGNRIWHRQGRRKLMAGLSAAAAMAAVAVATVVVAGLSPGPPPAAGPAAKPPPYYVAISNNAPKVGHTIAVVRATGTGAVIARIPVPYPYTDFGGVTGAADDRTFVLEAISYASTPVPAKFYLLRINPGARLTANRTRLTCLVPGGVRGSW